MEIKKIEKGTWVPSNRSCMMYIETLKNETDEVE